MVNSKTGKFFIQLIAFLLLALITICVLLFPRLISGQRWDIQIELMPEENLTLYAKWDKEDPAPRHT